MLNDSGIILDDTYGLIYHVKVSNYGYICLRRIYTKRANTRRNFAEFLRELLLHNCTLVSMKAVYINSESSPRIQRELAERKIICKMLQELARIVLAANIFFVNSSWHLQFLLKTFLSCLRIHIVAYIIIGKKLQIHSQTSVDGQARRIWTNCHEKRNTRASSRREPV